MQSVVKESDTHAVSIIISPKNIKYVSWTEKKNVSIHLFFFCWAGELDTKTRIVVAVTAAAV